MVSKRLIFSIGMLSLAAAFLVANGRGRTKRPNARRPTGDGSNSGAWPCHGRLPRRHCDTRHRRRCQRNRRSPLRNSFPIQTGSDSVQWFRYWAWNDDATDFLWVSGTYRIVPPARHWVPGYWNKADEGWQRVVGFWADQEKAHIELLPTPPEPIEEAVPAAPAEASAFQPGCWIYRENRYLWRAGFWAANRADWIWTSDSYVWTPGGYAFVDGYWDHSFRNRGLLFAPVTIDRRFSNRADWSYQPSYVVYDGFLLSSLFVRPSYGQYYFGDYYDQRYDRLGFVPWHDFRYGRSIGDPLFTHYQWQNRANAGWSRDMRGLYTARREDPAARPPRTLIQQNTRIKNITNNTTVENITNNTKVTNIANVTALAPLARVDRTFVTLQPVTKAQRVEAQKVRSQFKEFSTHRAQLEVPAAKHTQPAGEQPPKAIKVDLPKSRPAPLKSLRQRRTSAAASPRDAGSGSQAGGHAGQDKAAEARTKTGAQGRAKT